MPYRLRSNEIQIARRDERVAVLRKLELPIPSQDVLWDTMVAQNDNLIEFDPKKDKYPRVYVAPNAAVVPEINSLLSAFKSSTKNQKQYKFSAHLYYGDVDTATIGVHEDYVDVLFWQLHGMVEWRVPKGGQRTHWQDRLEEYDSYVLHPGDAIYVPTAMRHCVVSIGERFGVSLGAGCDAYDKFMPAATKRHLLMKRIAKQQQGNK